MIKVGIVVGTCSVGVELSRLVAQHPEAELAACYAGKVIAGPFVGCQMVIA